MSLAARLGQIAVMMIIAIAAVRMILRAVLQRHILERYRELNEP